MTFAKQSPLDNHAIEEYLSEFRTWLVDAGFHMLHDSKIETWQGPIHVEWVNPESGSWNSFEHRVEIRLNDGFPYRNPSIVLLDPTPLKRSLHFFSDNSMCLWQEPNGWAPFTAAQSLIARIQEWLTYYHTDSWPVDSYLPDLHVYLPRAGTVLIGDNWKPDGNFVHGEFVLWRVKNYPALPCLVATLSTNPSHASAEPEERLSKIVLGGAEEREKCFGFWFKVNKPFVPPDNLNELLELIDARSGLEAGAARHLLISRLTRHFAGRGFSIALGYPDVDQMRWLFLWIAKKPGTAIRLSERQQKVELNVKSFWPAPARREDLLRRSKNMSQALVDKKVAIYGVGALGSSISILLAKAGIGMIRLVDSDIVLPVNVSRHAAGLNMIEMPKTYAVEKLIQYHNPDCLVQTYDQTWDTQQINTQIQDVDLVIDATANIAFSLFLNHICVATERPLLFAATYRRAGIGRLILMRKDRTNNDPCLACYFLAPEIWDDERYPIIPPDPTTSFIENGCTTPTEEADAIHVEMNASLAALTSARFLSGDLLDLNLIIQVTEPLDGNLGVLSREGVHKLQNHSNVSCPICGSRK
jgi:molybdopterin/thiamine biosynthesis adenylyltransferase